MRTIAVVPARAGSAGLPGKNLARVGGRSLLQRAIDVAKELPEITEVVVSTNDPPVLAEARRHGATALDRPHSMAEPDTPTVAVLRHVLETHISADEVVLLQPTSPLRRPEDVRACIEARGSAPTVVTVTEVEHPIGWTFRRETDGTIDPVLGWDALPARRQESPCTYRLNGAVYVASVAHLMQGGELVVPGTVAVVMPAERSIDIDTQLDLDIARVVHDRLQIDGGSAP